MRDAIYEGHDIFSIVFQRKLTIEISTLFFKFLGLINAYL